MVDYPHYNYPLSEDRSRFVHYHRTGRLFLFRIRRLPYGLLISAFGWATWWVLWPRDVG